MATKRTSAMRYGVGMFGTSLSINMFKSLAAAFYFSRGLSMEKIALITFVYTFIDAIDNPVYGFISDNTRTRFGRRKPWLLISTPLFVIFFIFFYSPPAALSVNELFIWALIFYVITGTLDSLINANYGALFPELFPEDHLRAKTNGIRQIFQLIAMVIGIALTPMIAAKIGYTVTAIVYGVVSFAVIAYMTLGVREPKMENPNEKVKILPALLAMVTSKNFWLVGFTNAFYSAAMSLVVASVSFFVKYTLKLPDQQSTYLQGAVIIVAILGVAIWSNLIKKFGTMRLWRLALILLALSFIPMYFANSLIFAIIAGAFVGVGLSGAISTMDVVGAKILDEDYKKYGIKREGIYASTMGFMNRLNGLFVSLAFLLASRVYHFESVDDPGERPDEAARFILTIFPFIITVLSIIFSFFVKFDNSGKDKIVKELEPVSTTVPELEDENIY